MTEESSTEAQGKIDTLLQILRRLNFIVGAALILLGLGLFFIRGSVVALLIALTVIVVGPVEDLLTKHLRLPGVDPEQTKELVDQGTSLIFVLLLLLAMLIAL